MGVTLSQVSLLLIFLLSFSPLFSNAISDECGIAVYWGQHCDRAGGTCYDGTLRSVCETGKFKYVKVSFLATFGNGQTPLLNLGGHCNPTSGECVSYLAGHIEYCQSVGVKVFLSIGGGAGNYLLTSEQEAEGFADYLWNAYLGGSGTFRPLGPAVLDGIDYDLEGGSKNYYDYLAKLLKGYSTPERPVYLSAAPQCPYPDYYMGDALLAVDFDYVWVQFYNNYCDISGGIDTLVSVWNTWTTSLPRSNILLGLPATVEAASTGHGYIDPQTLTTSVLPRIQPSANYGGVMLWDRSFDVQHPGGEYSDAIEPYVCAASLNIKQVV